ncbi:2-dehydropantoate 2-reductase [Balamuthia mandrillaris]
MTSSASYDVIFLGVKAHQVEPIVEELQQLLQRNPHCVLVTLQNGIPWWYFQNLPPSSPQTTKTEEGEKEGEGGGTSASNDLYKNQDYFIRAVDPTGIISQTINPKQVIGCVVYPAAEMEQPGLIHHVEGDRFPVGELDHSTTSERVRALSSLLERAGFKAPVLEDIRAELWLKLWGSVCFNPVSALCHATLEELCQYPLTRQLAVAMMEEVQSIAQRLGARMRVPLERRIAGAERVGKHKTSTLQDVEAGRQPEIDAVIGSVVELGRLTGVATPHVNSVYACIKLLAKMMEDHRACVPLKSLAEQ